MSFYTDKQTQEDLNLLGRFKPNSVFSLFNKVKTAGGERLLEKFFREPLSDKPSIDQRSATFRRYGEMALQFPLASPAFERADAWLSAPAAGNYLSAAAGILYRKTMAALAHDPRYGELCDGLQSALHLLARLREMCAQANAADRDIELLRRILSDIRLRDIPEGRELSVSEVIRYDQLLRVKMRKEMEALLDAVYHVDVFMAVAGVARDHRFSYAECLPAEANRIRMTELWHPAVRNAVANSLTLDAEQNLLFLTGANMAGKSTFMKSFGIAVYLAHMGFPVPAVGMAFSVRDGLYSSINVPDNLQMGYSHFYAEVQRVKAVAAAVSGGAKLVVIFDELFKGTNVKDAFDATLAVSSAFGEYRACQFIISTHIIEVAAAMAGSPNVLFNFLPTVMDGRVPRYTYRLRQGVTADRHGMMIIEQENILEILG